MLRAVKVRLYPNVQQTKKFNKLLGCYRYVYNHMLSLKNSTYKENGTNLGLNELSKHFHNVLLKDENYVWLKEQNTKVMKQAIRQVLVAYKNFFTLHTGFPAFKSKKDVQTAHFTSETISKKNTFETKHITLTTAFKNVKFRCSNLQHGRLQRYKDSIRSATLSKTKSGRFFLSILLDVNEDEYKKLAHTGKEVGIDLGVKDFVITSDGQVFENKHFFRKEEKKIKKLHRQLSRKVKGSKNREKARLCLARQYERMTNKKEAYVHEVVNALLKEYDIIYMEDLNVQGMLKNHHLSKAISEVGFYRFKQVLTDKALLNNKRVILVDRWYASSKTCSKCGYVYKGLTLGEREWTCPVCGEHHDRDLNASKNILAEGKRLTNNRLP